MRTVSAPAADPFIHGVLRRLAGAGEGDFLPDVSDAELLSVLSTHHRLACRAGFFQETAKAA